MYSPLANGSAQETVDSSTVNNITYAPVSINGSRTTTSLLTTPQLEASTFLTLLELLINKAFSHSIVTGPKDLAPTSFRRLQSSTQMINEVGPEAFIFVVHTPIDTEEEVRVFATASAKRRTGKTFDSEIELVSQFKMLQSLDVGLNVEQWELMLMAVDPTVQKQGLAGNIIGLVEEEIRRRTAGTGKEVQIVLTTAKEYNEKFYSRRGYIATGEIKIEAGTAGSVKGFTVLEMMKKL
ncbi:hypothetical protein MMC17_002381 [Xylographa soralifera]|nr:hypothetical protein [Xylographa soralifera]